MVKNRNRTPLAIAVVAVAVVTLFGLAFLLGGNNAVTGNVSTLQLTENHRDMNCEAWNNLAITKDGVKTVVGSGRQGFNPSFDTSLLSLTDGSSEVDQLHVQLVLLCDGNFIKRASATTVSGTVSLQLCGDPSGARTTCFAGQERNFQQISGIASSTETFFNIPIKQTSLTLISPEGHSSTAGHPLFSGTPTSVTHSSTSSSIPSPSVSLSAGGNTSGQPSSSWNPLNVSAKLTQPSSESINPSPSESSCATCSSTTLRLPYCATIGSFEVNALYDVVNNPNVG